MTTRCCKTLALLAAAVVENGYARELMGRYQRSTIETVKSTWHVFDVDGDGSVVRDHIASGIGCVVRLGLQTQEEMGKVLASCGLNLAPWEIREMVSAQHLTVMHV